MKPSRNNGYSENPPELTVYLLVEEKYDHNPVVVFDAADKAKTAAEDVVRRNPKRYKRPMTWRVEDGSRRSVYSSEDERQWFEIVPMTINAYFNGVSWQNS